MYYILLANKFLIKHFYAHFTYILLLYIHAPRGNQLRLTRSACLNKVIYLSIRIRIRVLSVRTREKALRWVRD